MSFILIVGCGRTGSAIARDMLAAGHEVSVLDDDPLSHARLDAGQESSWEDAGGRFTIGKAIEREALVEAGVEQADVFIASTNGDNTNLTISQIASQMFSVDRVIARVMDPARADWYRSQGLEIICPTQFAIERFEETLASPGAAG